MVREDSRDRMAGNLSKIFTTVVMLLIVVQLVKMDLHLLHKILVVGGSIAILRLSFFLLFKIMFKGEYDFSEDEIVEHYGEEEESLEVVFKVPIQIIATCEED